MMIRSLATRADRSVSLAGSTTVSPADWRIIRLAPDGSVDSAFGGATGRTVNIGGHDAITAIALQPDGKVLASGFGKGAAGHGQTLVRRYLEDGTTDPSFTTYRDAFGVNDIPTALTRHADGRVVVSVNSKVAPTTTSSSFAWMTTVFPTTDSELVACRSSMPAAGVR